MTVGMHAQIGDRSCANQAIRGNHYRPVLIYMLKMTDTTTEVGSGSWFKIEEGGYVSWISRVLFSISISCSGWGLGWFSGI
jgi:hypothetical protein